MTGRRGSMAERFKEKVDRSGECWVWTACRDANGYGHMLGDVGKVELAHRISWRLANGPIPDGMNVLHRCDNPPCVRPSHLFLGTQRENLADMRAKGRAKGGRLSRPGEAHPLARITAADVTKAREMRSQGALYRDIAAALGISRQHASAIVRGTRWPHLFPTIKQGASQ